MSASRSRPRGRGVATALLAAVLGAAGLVPVLTAPAAADSAPADPATPTTVTADGLPTVQINGVVWKQIIAGNKVFVGGEFTNARPAGAAPGVNTVPRSNLLAYDLQTGVLDTSFAPVVNAQVKALALSEDGSRLFVGGNFTQVNGINRYRIAAFNTATGALVTTFTPGTNTRVTSLAVSGNRLFVGGNFTQANGVARNYLAAFDATTGALLPWAPNPNDTVQDLTVSPDGSQLVVGGIFTTFNGSSNPGFGLARVDATSGASLPLPVNSLIRNAGSTASITSLSTDGDTFYGTGYHFGGVGNFEGVFAGRWSDGSLVWVEDCHGDTYGAWPVGDVIYQVSHKHYCGNVADFPQTTPWTFYRATAVSKAVGGVVTRDPYGYFNYEGNPRPDVLNWYPTLDAGSYTGVTQAAWTVTGNSQYVLMGGEFPRVNNVPQQGLVRFAVKEIAPNNQGPRVSGDAFNPRVVPLGGGSVRVNWKANWDKDNETLTYKVYRGSSLIDTRTADSRFWKLPTMGLTDTGLPPGSTQTYRVTATDPFGKVAGSNTVSVTVAGGDASDYAELVLAGGASSYWRLGDGAATTAADLAGFDPLTLNSGTARGAAGALTGDSDASTSFNGTTNGFGSTTTAITGPDTFTLEAWVKTTSTAGGKIVGFGNKSTGNSNSYDRHLYMNGDGRVYFGAYPGSVRTVNGTAAYNDGAWHHVAGTLGADGMKLYVDGALVGQRADTTSAQSYTGFWRVGGDQLNSWPGNRTSNYLSGSIDEVAVYPTVLDAATVQAHRSVGLGAPPPNLSPTAAFTSSVSQLQASFNASASSDPDGTVASYAWDFGDGSTGTGATASRTYAAAGTYTVSLTVTDDDGATDVATSPVTVTAPPPNAPPTASFTSSTSGLQVSVNASGSSDSDGTIASYGWDFGDGSTAAGQTSTHAYASAGTYTVTLTVTDDDGAPATTTRSVTVTAPPGDTSVARDSFERTVSGGLGTADKGGAWTVTGGSANASVSGGLGRLNLAVGGSNLNALLTSVTAVDVEVRSTVAMGKLADGGGAYLSVIGRRVGSSDYRARAKVSASGAVTVQLLRDNTTLVAAAVAGLSVAPGERLQLVLQATGSSPTTLRAKVWKVGAPEPAGWQLTTTDSTAALQVAGGFGIGAYVSATATTTPILVSFDDVWAGPPGA